VTTTTTTITADGFHQFKVGDMLRVKGATGYNYTAGRYFNHDGLYVTTVHGNQMSVGVRRLTVWERVKYELAYWFDLKYLFWTAFGNW